MHHALASPRRDFKLYTWWFVGMNGFLEGDSGVKGMYQRESIKTAKQSDLLDYSPGLWIIGLDHPRLTQDYRLLAAPIRGNPRIIDY